MTIKTEELIKILESSADEGEDFEYNDVLTFMITMDITKGKQTVSTDFLYDLYKSWSKVKQSKETFVRTIDGMITLQKQKKICLVNKDIKQLEEITKRLTKKTKKPQIRAKQVVLFDFMEDTNTYSGDIWVKALDLFNEFIAWMYAKNRRSRYAYISFLDNMFVMFEYKYTKHGVYVKLNRKVSSGKA